MKQVLLLNGSPHSKASQGYQLAGELFARLQALHPALRQVERDLVRDPLPPVDAGYALAITSAKPADSAEFDWSERVIVELEQSDALIITIPMHNFTVPASLKLWIDHVLRIFRTFDPTPKGKVGRLTDRPTYVIVNSGGFHHGERANQPDFLSDYLRYALGCIGIRDVHFVYLQGMAYGEQQVAASIEQACKDVTALPINGATHRAA